MTLNHINQNIENIKYWNSVYSLKRNKIALTPVNFKALCVCGVTGCFIGEMATALNYGYGSTIFLGGMAGYAIGLTVPKIIKEIRIGDYNYQIMMNNFALKALEKQKSLKKEK